MGGRRVSVAGLGNVLMGDDALGPRAVHEFEARYEVPAGVSIDDLGTPGLDLYPHLAGLEAVILIDTVRADGAPGEIRRYGREELMRHAPAQRVSPHDPGVKETLASLEFSGNGPGEFVLLGVIPERVEYVTGLSNSVLESLPELLQRIHEELGRLGYPPRARPVPRAIDLWWDRTVHPAASPSPC